MMKKFMIPMALVGLSILVACGEEDSDDDATTTATDVEVSTGTALNVGVLALGSIEADDVGLSSSGLYLKKQLQMNLQDGDSSDSDEESETVSDRDSRCSVYGNPMTTDGTRMEQTDAEFPLASMYCAVAFNSGSPDSVLGAIGIPGVLLCELERAGAWDSDDDWTTEGNNVGNITITLSTNCADAWIVERLSDGGDGVYALQDVTLTDLGDDHGYDRKITLTTESEPESFYIRASNNVIAARAEGWAFSVDLVTNRVNYETLGESTDSDNNTSYVRRIRLAIDGELSSTGAFSSISSIEALKLEGQGVDSFWSTIVTVKGEPGTAVAYNFYEMAQGTTFQAEEDGCSTTDCSSITRISGTQSEIDTFHQNAQVDFLVHDAETGVIDFDTVDLSANVTYSTRR
ncbi:hypothetical protein [Pseudobacteriovorax antillogorgiicola]|uniref:Uncharacterized protein n=1 Tax=Pseudobacteriovorax antillogorgiicola TaxID=1513793 RepID=A0A1Y6C6I1_9BACT|nr:hypothetical protein [Pseudobacteriovorax antillogorgiicola]TCS49438.1 hypothetical protein EDD56_115119 [Pseudobacteriovorax antillogorgiicola]SMF46611.1 hypothetical protein SAMN06296036_11466 [Pseudobacteriovorax antillogorgiicola]